MRDEQKFLTTEPLKCLWMTAGMVGYKLCEYAYDCENCPFDHAIRQNFRNGEKEQGFKVDESVFYHPTHVWLRVEEEGRIRVGLDDFGQRLPGRIYSVRLPEPGESISRDAGCWSITHAFGEVWLSGGMNGLVLQRNQQLEQLPSLIHTDPYGKGWAFVLEPQDLLHSLKSLYYGKKVSEWYVLEANKLRSMLAQSSADVGTTLQDGGTLRSDLMYASNAEIINAFLSARAPKSGAGANLERR